MTLAKLAHLMARGRSSEALHSHARPLLFSDGAWIASNFPMDNISVLTTTEKMMHRAGS